MIELIGLMLLGMDWMLSNVVEVKKMFVDGEVYVVLMILKNFLKLVLLLLSIFFV